MSTFANRKSRGAFTLVELLVVLAIIALLAGLTFPAIGSVRENARRAVCINNLHNLGLAATAYVGVQNEFPNGMEAHEFGAQKDNPWNFYRWSALVRLLPHLDEQQTYDKMDLSVPMYGRGKDSVSGNTAEFAILPFNRTSTSKIIEKFLCPSDHRQAVTPGFGPTNYVACFGSGPSGSPSGTDGIFGMNSHTFVSDISDGQSSTVLFSESLLGAADGARHEGDLWMDYKFTMTSPMVQQTCDTKFDWNTSDNRGFSWASGEFRCAAYNHHYPPNAKVFDCIGVQLGTGAQMVVRGQKVGGPSTRLIPFGWKAARSRHRDGVNVVMADGSTRFVGDNVDPMVWYAYATRSGNERLDATRYSQ